MGLGGREEIPQEFLDWGGRGRLVPSLFEMVPQGVKDFQLLDLEVPVGQEEAVISSLKNPLTLGVGPAGVWVRGALAAGQGPPTEARDAQQPPAEGPGLSVRSVLSSLCSTFLGVLSFSPFLQEAGEEQMGPVSGSLGLQMRSWREGREEGSWSG